MIFPACILRRETGVTKAKAIQKLITRRLDQWSRGKYPEMVQEIVNIAKQGTGGKPNEEDDESIARKYHSMVIEGKL